MIKGIEVIRVPTMALPPPGSTEWLDSVYLQLCEYRHNPYYCKDAMRGLVEAYAIELEHYLRAHQIDVMRVVPSIDRIELILPRGASVEVRLFDTWHAEPTMYLYIYSRWLRVDSVVGIVKHVRSKLRYLQCSWCHYSNSNTSFCGRGMEMHTGNCSKYLTYPQ